LALVSSEFQTHHAITFYGFGFFHAGSPPFARNCKRLSVLFFCITHLAIVLCLDYPDVFCFSFLLFAVALRMRLRNLLRTLVKQAA
jgi:hypothetical protein